jgi:hypothetical protein
MNLSNLERKNRNKDIITLTSEDFHTFLNIAKFAHKYISAVNNVDETKYKVKIFNDLEKSLENVVL